MFPAATGRSITKPGSTRIRPARKAARSATGSERIRRALVGVRQRGIPVVISMGSVAASGGYWIATAGNTIFAEPATVTGSIGVFGILPSFEGTLEKIGVG